MRFSRSAGSLKSETRGADDAGRGAEFRLHNFNTVLRDLCRERDLSAHAGGENVEMFLADPAADEDARGRIEWSNVHVAVTVALTARCTMAAAFASTGAAANTARLSANPNGFPAAAMAVPDASDSQQPCAPQ